MDGWAGPTLGIFLISQLGAAVWWAGTTQERVDQNTSIIEQVVVNDKNIAVVKNQQTNIMKDMVELKVILSENQKLLQKIIINNQSARATAQSTANTAYSNAPGLIDTGLQIGGSIYGAQEATRTKTTGPKIQNYPTYT